MAVSASGALTAYICNTKRKIAKSAKEKGEGGETRGDEKYSRLANEVS